MISRTSIYLKTCMNVCHQTLGDALAVKLRTELLGMEHVTIAGMTPQKD